MAKYKKLEMLTMKDNFMFGAVMTDPKNCRPFLEMALGIPIGKPTVNLEKSLVYHPEYKGVRLDVEARDENRTRYNVEMQVIPKPALERRARYYHSQIDMDLLARGDGYENLPDVYVIFVCDFDPFDFGKYRYTFRNICLEESGFAFRDGQTTMFLSTCGTNPQEVPESLVSFLKYIGLNLQESTEESENGYVKQIQAAVHQVKASREWEARFMLLQEMLQDEREAGRIERSREVIFVLLEDKPGDMPEDLKNKILSEKDSDVLERCLKEAAAATSVENFIQRISCICGTESEPKIKP